MVASGGCSFTTGHLQVATTRSVHVDRALLPAATGVGLIGRGRSCVHVIGIFAVTPLPSLDDAIEQALLVTGADVLRDVHIRYELFYVPPLFGRGCYVVEGYAS